MCSLRKETEEEEEEEGVFDVGADIEGGTRHEKWLLLAAASYGAGEEPTTDS